MLRRKDNKAPVDPLLIALRAADAAYQELAADIHEPWAEEVPLDELAQAVARLTAAIDALRARS